MKRSVSLVEPLSTRGFDNILGFTVVYFFQINTGVGKLR